MGCSLAGVDDIKSAPDLRRYVLPRDIIEQNLEHLSGEEDYRVASACAPRRGRDRCGFPAGGVSLVDTLRTAGLDQALSETLAAWRRPTAVHDPAKVVLDLAVTLALGGDCLADIALLRAEPGVYGPVGLRSHLSLIHI